MPRLIARKAENDAPLLALFRAIAAHDPKAAARLLAESPSLVTQALRVGASRQHPGPYFLEPILHYAYAHDTALHFAAAASLCAIAELLVAQGANVRAKNRRGAEPLHYAADSGPGLPAWNPETQRATIAFLVGAGASVNAPDKSGVLPLHRAVRTRSAAAVRALLMHGAGVRDKNKSGSTPLHLAVLDTGRSGSGSAEAREQQREIIVLLLEHGARRTDPDARGKSVEQLELASWIRELLLESSRS